VSGGKSHVVGVLMALLVAAVTLAGAAALALLSRFPAARFAARTDALGEAAMGLWPVSFSLAAIPASVLVMALGATTSWRAAPLLLFLLGVSPLLVGFALAGEGLGVLGILCFWVTLWRQPMEGSVTSMAAGGLGVAGLLALVPGGAQWLLPLGTVLFLFAPQNMRRRNMRVFYLLLFAPVAMLAGALAYLQLVHGVGFGVADLPPTDHDRNMLPLLPAGLAVLLLGRDARTGGCLGALGAAAFLLLVALVARPAPYLLCAAAILAPTTRRLVARGPDASNLLALGALSCLGLAALFLLGAGGPR
jgi:hypothetical protein